MVKEPDQTGTLGATVVAPLAGTVKQSFYHANAGNMIQIDHGGGYFTTYLHLQSRAVQVGAKVAAGATIGLVGKSGPTANDHPHLHFELGFDQNGDGSASWGEAGSERVRPTIGGVVYGTANSMTWRNVTSGNTCATPPPTYWVDTHADAPGYATPGGTRTGTLNKGTNYVYCRVWGPNVQVGADYNHWWLKTDLDSGSPTRNQWVSAYYLKRWGNDQAKDNSGRDIPNC
ncbi:hypothetical protein Sru01_28580 [Sphaerisporangium rufum]|uniref:M23ase beta-sheet core domain-containing protein n=2 Tax=Sphaerisporangium rufum TaxID=1381558 RepID=A0A919UYB3_9ACTN|nr:hypothetical protein Sru01_28580 [Sphaerisporangium rufum]